MDRLLRSARKSIWCSVVILIGIVMPFQTVFADTYDHMCTAIYDCALYDPNAQTCGSTTDTTLTGKDNPEKIWNFFKSKGLSDKQVAGIMGNLQTESSFDPERMEIGGRSKDPYDALSKGWGLIQWSGNTDSRSTGDKVTNAYKAAGISGNIYDLSTQLNLIWHHMNNDPVITKTFDLEHFKTINDEVEASAYFGDKIEGFGVQGNRLSYATDILNKYAGSGSINTAAAVSTDNGGCADNSATQSPDCVNASGTSKILCEAKKYDVVNYSLGGGHAGGAAYHKACTSIKADDSSCALDCSGLVGVVVYDAFGNNKSWDTNAIRADSANWKEINYDDLRPGDIFEPNSDHVEIVDHVTGSTIHSFGAHSANYPQPRQVGPSSWPNGSDFKYYRYVGQGA